MRLDQEVRLPPGTGLTLGAALAVAMALVPVPYLVWAVTGKPWDELIEFVILPPVLAAFVTTAWLSLAVGATAMVLGGGLAWMTTRTNLGGRRAWGVLVVLPVVIPNYLAAPGWANLWEGFRSPLGAWMVLSLLTYPLAYLPVAAALSNTDPALAETARSLGHSRRRVGRTITLPLLGPPLLAGGLLASLLSAADFGVGSLLGVKTAPVFIYSTHLSGLDAHRSAAQAVVVVAFALVLGLTEGRLRRRRRSTAPTSRPARPAPAVDLGHWRWPAGLIPALAVAAGVGVPLAAVVSGLARDLGRPVDWVGLAEAGRDSALTAGPAAVIAVVLALPLAALVLRRPGRLPRMAERCVYLTLALPGVITAFSLIFFGARVTPWIYQRLPMLVLAYVVLFLPLALSPLVARMAQVPASAGRVARSLGGSRGRVAATVTLPILAPGLAAGAVLVFLASIRELPATLLVGPFDVATLSVTAYRAALGPGGARLALPALITVVLSALALLAASRRISAVATRS
ncbi:MAG: ABC transporter permease [Acidimicrobiales bacterium]